MPTSSTRRKAVLAVVDEAGAHPAADIRIVPSQNTAEFAATQVTELQGNIMTALALVMVVVVAAMGFRSGVIVGLGIPVSLLFSVIIIYLLGYTFNFMVMFGMLLGLGMLIDGAIVVTEYADRKMGEGLDHREAYSEAVKRMFWPVTASTATTLAAFLPLIFWPGISGQFMRYLPVTVFTVLSGSLLYALLFGPVLGPCSASRRCTARGPGRARGARSRRPHPPRRRHRRLRALMRSICNIPGITVGLIVRTALQRVLGLRHFGRGMVFFNDADPQFVTVSVSGRGNFSPTRSTPGARGRERGAAGTGHPLVNTQTMLPGGTADQGSAAAPRTTASAPCSSTCCRSRTGTATASTSSAICAQRTGNMAGITRRGAGHGAGPPGGQAGPDRAAFAATGSCSSRPWRASAPTWTRCRSSSISTTAAPCPRSSGACRWTGRRRRCTTPTSRRRGGAAAGDQRRKDRRVPPDGADDAVDIRARFPAAGARHPRHGRPAHQHQPGPGAAEQLRDASSRRRAWTPSSASTASRRAYPRQRRRGRTGRHHGRGRSGSGWTRRTFDPRLDIQFRGANEEQADSLAFVQVAFLLSLLLMFVLLVTQFNSFYQSGLILLAVIMSTAGVLLGLLVTGSPFSAILTGVGVVALAGIVVNNNIVLIDTFNYVRSEHPELPVPEAIVRASAQRLRPVMLTTVTTVFGLLPLACDLSVDIVNRSITAGGQMATFWGPLSQAIVFGLSFATILTLIATPALLALPYQLRSAGSCGSQRPERLGPPRPERRAQPA
jgi:multidrug efflux pump